MFSVGERVRLKANPSRMGMVDAVHAGTGEPQYDIFFSADLVQTYPEHALLGGSQAEQPDDSIAGLRRWDVIGAEQFRAFITLAKLTKPVASNLYSFLASRTELLPYQFKPVLKLIDSPYSRLLIADEVGLGKTIEAGIILTELNARAPLRRVLVACPSALKTKWRNELNERFDWELQGIDGSASFREFVDESRRFPEHPARLIGSLHLLRRQENVELLLQHQPRFDAVIVDEAHHMRNQGTATNHLGEALSELTDTLVFLTATPLNLGERDFFELLSLLVPEEFNDFETFPDLIEPNEHLNSALRALRGSDPPDYRGALAELSKVEATTQGSRFRADARYRETRRALDQLVQDGEHSSEGAVDIQGKLVDLNTLSNVFTRTKKREVSEYFPERRARRITVDFKPEEQAFYDAVSRWVLEHYTDVPAGFILTTYQCQAGSCIPALGQKLEQTQRLGEITFTSDEVYEAADVDEGEQETVSLELDRRQRSGLQALADAWRDVRGIDSKYEKFEAALRDLFAEGVEKVLVFSFFIKTIDYLAERLSALEVDGEPIEVLKLYGPVSTDDRHAVVNRFRTGTRPQVLLSSEVGSEGLDFQFCSTMFNYDMPWNPMRVEQRIGRLDRYGQAAEVIQINNLVVEGTIEDRIFYRLYERIQIFQRSIGDLESILGDELRELQRGLFTLQLTPEEQERKALQIGQAIVRRQQDYERFEEESKRFIGGDEVFAERFHDIEQSERYITAVEVEEFLRGFLARRFSRVKLHHTAQPQVLEFDNVGDAGFSRFLHESVYRDPQRSKIDFRLVNRLTDHSTALVTFDARSAMQDRTLEFLSIHHPLLRAAVNELAGKRASGYAGALSVKGIEGGPYLFFVGEMTIRAAREEVEYVTAVVDRDGRVDEGLSRSFFRLLSRADSLGGELTNLVTDAWVDEAESAARGWIAGERQARHDELSRVHDSALDAQLESLRQSHDRRTRRLQARIVEAEEMGREKRLLTMFRSQLTNMEARYQEKARELESRRGVDVGYSIVATGVMSGANGTPDHLHRSPTPG